MRWLFLPIDGFDTAENQLHPPKTDTKTIARKTCLLMVGAVAETSDMMKIADFEVVDLVIKVSAEMA